MVEGVECGRSMVDGNGDGDPRAIDDPRAIR